MTSHITWRGGEGAESVSQPDVRYLSGPDGALQRGLVLRQVGVGLRHPGQGGAVWVEVRLLVRWVEEPTLREHQFNRDTLSGTHSH